MEFFTTDFFLNLFLLTFLEVILGIDNLIFIALVVQKLPKHLRKNARIFGLSLAMLIRVLMLMTLSFIMGLNEDVITLFGFGFSWKDILLITGGLFLMVKSGHEVWHDTFGGHVEVEKEKTNIKDSVISAIIQISLVDFVFSFDSIITAIGITHDVPNNMTIIVIAIAISMWVMLVASEHISRFISEYPSLKMIALAFIFMIGLVLLFDGLNIDIEKGYLYFALFFTLTIECFNIVARRRRENKEIK